MTKEELDKLVEQVESDNILILWYNDSYFNSVHVRDKGKKLVYSNEMTVYPYKHFNHHNIRSIIRYEFVSFEEWNNKRRKCILKSLKERLKDPESNASLLKKELEDMQWKFVQDKHSDKTYGLLVDIISTDEDYYYVLLGPDKKLIYASCVGGIQILSKDIKELDEIREWLETDATSLYKYAEGRLGAGDVSFSTI